MQTLVLSEYESRRHQSDDVIRAFNRDTLRLAALLLGAVGFAILVLGILTREREPNAADLPGKELLTSRDLLPNANPLMLSQAGTLNGENSVREAAWELTRTKGPAVADSRLNSFPQMEIPALTQTPVFGRMTQVNNPGVRDKDSRCSPRVSQGAPRISQKRLGRISYTSSVRLRFVGLGSRLAGLWHQDVARAEKPRNWTPFLNRSKEYRKSVLSGIRKSSPGSRALAITLRRSRPTHPRPNASPHANEFRVAQFQFRYAQLH